MFELPQPTRHWGCRVNHEVEWCGERAIILQNELLQIVIFVDKGAEIIQFLYKPLDVDFLWRAPNQHVRRGMFTPAGGFQIEPFLDHYNGGWFEVVPNGGPACEFKGASLGYYAETINIPWGWKVLEDTPECVRVGLWVRTYRTPFLLQKTLELRADTAALYIEECLINEGKEPVDFMWGHHPVVGPPFLDEHCRISAPECKVEVFHDDDGPDFRIGLHQEGNWPYILDRHGETLDLRIMPPKQTTSIDCCYLTDITNGWIAIHNPGKKVGFGLAWDHDVFRYVWLWQALDGGLGYPWYGRTYNVGLEPWTSYPCCGLVEAIERGTAMRLDPDQSLSSWLTAVAFANVDEVTMIDKDGKVR